MNTLERQKKGGDEDEETERLQGLPEDSEGEEDQLNKESHLVCRVLMIAGSPLCVLNKKAEGANLLQERREKWKSIQS